MQTAVNNINVSERERELGGIISAYNEVTERLKEAHVSLTGEVARLHDELRRKNAELRRRERLAALGEMAAGLAHEIRNPLGGIALYASMLEKETGHSAGTKNAATRIASGVRTLERLVSEILDFAQEHHLERQHCRLSSVLATLQDAMAPWEAQTQAHLRMDDAAMKVEAFMDSGRMHRVLVNLVMNGLQASGAGGEVSLTASCEAGMTLIEICDSGPGIKEENLHRIFNPFFTTKDTGTGLGLAIVHRIVEAHDGTIRASNNPGGGAKFVVRLPLGPQT
jgi:signal transduction histidine kinase